MRVKLYALHQLLGQREDIILGAEDMVDGDAAGDLLEILEFNLQREGTALEIVLQDAPFKLENGVIEMDGNSGVLADVGLKGLLTAYALPLPLADYRAVIDASREIVEHLPHLTELLG